MRWLLLLAIAACSKEQGDAFQRGLHNGGGVMRNGNQGQARSCRYDGDCETDLGFVCVQQQGASSGNCVRRAAR